MKMNSQTPPKEKSRTDEHLIEALGPLSEVLEREGVTEVMANPDGSIWVEDQEHGMWRVPEMVLSADQRGLIVRLAATASGMVVSPEAPSVGAKLPHRQERFQGFMSPATEAPAFAIRSPYTLDLGIDDYVARGAMTEEQAQLLLEAVAPAEGAPKNILVVGATSSGKTTLANAILRRIKRTGDRVFAIEDQAELDPSGGHVVCVRVKRGSAFDYKEALFAALRSRPDRIVVGEVRDGAAGSELLKSWNTGHGGGIATIHADSAQGALPRLEMLLREVYAEVPRDLVAQAIDVVVFVERARVDDGSGVKRAIRRVRHVAMLSDHLTPGGKYRFTHHAFHPTVPPDERKTDQGPAGAHALVSEGMGALSLHKDTLVAMAALSITLAAGAVGLAHAALVLATFL